MVKPRVKDFSSCLHLDIGGGFAEAFAIQTTNQVQCFCDEIGSGSVSSFNSRNIETFIAKLATIHKPSTVLFYIRSLLKYSDFLLYKDYISSTWHSRVKLLLSNMRRSFDKKKKQQHVNSAVQAESERLPTAARNAYFSSTYIQDIQERLRSAQEPDPVHFLAFRDYLLTCITFFNGHRPNNYTLCKSIKTS